MRKFLLFSILFFLVSCSSNKDPDVSGVKMDVEVSRFDQDFFGLDTTDISASLTRLRQKYPFFLRDYFENILGLPWDSAGGFEPVALDAVSRFLTDYRPVKDSSDKIFKNFSPWEKQIKKAFQYVRYYFPDYDSTQRLITFIGPFDAFFSTSFGIQGDVLTEEGLGIGLQLHLGKNYSFFTSEIGKNLYPEYLSANFNPENITVDCMRNVVDDLFPGQSRASTLIEKMVITGRGYYLLTKFLPDEEDHIILDYTPAQMKGAYQNESVIWDFFLNNDFLNTTDPGIVQNYIGPSPKTQEFGEGSPGNLGGFTGLQIVKKFMQKFPETSLQELMTLPPREIYERSKYKPKR